MTFSLEELIGHVQHLDWETKTGEQQLNDLIDRVLRTERFGRSRQRAFQSPLVGEINRELRSHLRQDLAQTLPGYSPRRRPAAEWKQDKQQQAYRAVFNNSTLTRLACEAQRRPSASEPRRQALNDLIAAIRLSRQLSRQHGFSPLYEEAVSLTLAHVYEHIDQYQPRRSPVMAWVNYWLAINLREVKQQQADPLAWESMAQRIRTKARLRRRLTSIHPETIHRLLTFALVAATEQPLHPVLLADVWVCLELSYQLSCQPPGVADDFLFALVDHMLPLSAQIEALDDRVEAIPQTEAPLVSEQIRQYIETDPNHLCQQHIKHYPTLTFQRIALAYLDHTPWQAMSDRFGPPVPTLSSFFRRQLQAIAPDIRAYLSDN